MFWGLTLESGKRYAQKVESSFHVSMAALDLKSAGSDANESVSVILTVDKNDYLLCNLSKHKYHQQALDLNFQTGDTIAFMTKGKGMVHLTGYLVLEDDFSQFPSDIEEEEESEDEVEVSAALKKELMKAAKKRKGEQEAKSETKKAKIGKPVNKPEDSDEEDSDEEEEVGSFFDKMSGEADSDEESESGEEEEDDEEEDEEAEEEESDEEESDESEEEVSPAPKQKQKQQQQSPAKTPVMNGTSNQKESGKKSKKDKGAETPKGQTPKQQQQQTSKGQQQQTPKGQQQQTPKGQQQQKTTPQQQKSPAGGQQKLAGGIIVEDLIQGNGPLAKPGRTACVYYVGRLKHNNKQFDSTQSGSGFKFRLGRGEVIKGWDIGVQGMKVGGKRKIICPPQMAYGTKGSPPTIPPNSYLVFDVELRSVS